MRCAGWVGEWAFWNYVIWAGREEGWRVETSLAVCHGKLDCVLVVMLLLEGEMYSTFSRLTGPQALCKTRSPLSLIGK